MAGSALEHAMPPTISDAVNDLVQRVPTGTSSLAVVLCRHVTERG
jgi:hypothetical protein